MNLERSRLRRFAPRVALSVALFAAGCNGEATPRPSTPPSILKQHPECLSTVDQTIYVDTRVSLLAINCKPNEAFVLVNNDKNGAPTTVLNSDATPLVQGETATFSGTLIEQDEAKNPIARVIFPVNQGELSIVSREEIKR